MPFVLNPPWDDDERTLDEYERAKEQEAASPSKGIGRQLYAAAGAARLGHTHGSGVSDVPEDEVVALGRALFTLGAESYAFHKGCFGGPAFERWLKVKTA